MTALHGALVLAGLELRAPLGVSLEQAGVDALDVEL
jgi:hypothetical protein